MSSRRILGAILLVVGLLLVGFGVNSAQTAPEKAMEGITGRYTKNTMWYLIGGAAAVIGGAVIAFGGCCKK
jgi:drug/metabolite transporter (DMT)-like permease